MEDLIVEFIFLSIWALLAGRAIDKYISDGRWLYLASTIIYLAGLLRVVFGR